MRYSVEMRKLVASFSVGGSEHSSHVKLQTRWCVYRGHAHICTYSVVLYGGTWEEKTELLGSASSAFFARLEVVEIEKSAI